MRLGHEGLRERSIGILGAISFAFATVATAQISQAPQIGGPVINEGRTILAGSGCSLQNDGLSVINGSQGTVIGLNLSNMTLSATGRSTCILRMPITIPAGYSLLVTGGEANGYADLTSGESLSVSTTMSIIGLSSGIAGVRLVGPAYQDFGPIAADPSGLSSVFDSSRRILTRCATSDTSGLLGLNIGATLISPSHSSFAMITDAAIGVQLVPCH